MKWPFNAKKTQSKSEVISTNLLRLTRCRIIDEIMSMYKKCTSFCKHMVYVTVKFINDSRVKSNLRSVFF